MTSWLLVIHGDGEPLVILCCFYLCHTKFIPFFLLFRMTRRDKKKGWIHLKSKENCNVWTHTNMFMGTKVTIALCYSFVAQHEVEFNENYIAQCLDKKVTKWNKITSNKKNNNGKKCEYCFDAKHIVLMEFFVFRFHFFFVKMLSHLISVDDINE